MIAPGRAGRLASAAALTALALLPIANWIPGGHSAAFYPSIFDEWWSGTLVVLGFGVILALASRRIGGLWDDGGWGRIAERLDPRRPGRAVLLALLAAAAYATLARLVLAGRPLLIDEIVEVWQARVFASGHLWVPSTGHPELFGAMHIVDHAGRVFSQFPAGGPAMLALGSLIHAEWLVDPAFAALGLWWWSRVLRSTGEPLPVATGAFLLLAFAPFALFMSASHMNHVTTLTWTLAGMAGLAAVVASERPRPGLALLLGLAFGIAATIRPVDALAFGAPAGLWLFARAVRDRTRALECAAAAAGMALPIALQLWINAQTTGHPLQFGYTLLWGKDHGLGFHAAPWGDPHTPARGLELINIYLLHLQSYFLETPFPSLLPALAVLAFGPRLRPFDRYLATSGALLLGLYWAYWHNGFYLGPRFVYPLLPVLALWTARFGAMLAERTGRDGLPVRIWVHTAVVSAILAVVLNIPIRARQYRYAFLSVRQPLEEFAQAQGVHDALVLVRESWGAQSVARMWGLGVSRAETDFLYRHTDMCQLEQRLTALEHAGARDTAAVSGLLAIAVDSSALVDSVLSTDLTENLRPGTPYTPVCQERLRDDRTGFTLYPPALLEARRGNVYVRDLHARDSLALALYPGRPVYLLAPDDTALGSLARYHPVRRDSLLAAWGLPAGWRGDR